MNILITGGLGFIGSHLSYELDKNHNITIMDNFDLNYPGYAKIFRGPKQGVTRISKLEEFHREINVKYRFELIKKSKASVHRQWSFEKISYNNPLLYDLIINCGGLSEAILSKYFSEFCFDSIVKGTENIKTIYSCPILHISSSMVYGSWEGKIDEDYLQKPVDNYGFNKLYS